MSAHVQLKLPSISSEPKNIKQVMKNDVITWLEKNKLGWTPDVVNISGLTLLTPLRKPFGI